MSVAPTLAPFVTAGDALASAFAQPVADARETLRVNGHSAEFIEHITGLYRAGFMGVSADSALRHCRAFVADLQSPADPEARELLGLIDRALGVSR